MIHLLGSRGKAVFGGSVGGVGARSPTMPPERPVKAKKSEEIGAGVEAVLRIALAHHAVAEPVGGGRKLDRHEGYPAEAVEFAPVMKDLLDDAGLGQPLHPVVQDHPLIVPGHQATCLGEDVGRRRRCSRQRVADLVVELEDCEMRLRHQEVLVVSVVADQRETLRAPRQVVAELALARIKVLADQELGAVPAAGHGIAGIKMRAAIRAEAVDGVEVERRGAEILDAERVLLLVGEGRQVERDVVVDELPQIGESGGNPRVVAGRIAGVGFAHRLGQRLQLGVRNLERVQRREHAPEHPGIAVAGQHVQPLAAGMPAGDAMARSGLHGGGRGGLGCLAGWGGLGNRLGFQRHGRPSPGVSRARCEKPPRPLTRNAKVKSRCLIYLSVAVQTI